MLRISNKTAAAAAMCAMFILSMPIFAYAGGVGGGGGSGLAGEIYRATNVFIEAVKNNPDIFKGVDPNALTSLVNPVTHKPILDPRTHKPVPVEILVTDDSIKTCVGDGTLDAHSDAAKGYSLFNVSAWASDDDMEKVQLAGHERLVLAGYEKSNQYNISDRIYDVEVKDLEKIYGSVPNICSFGHPACQDARQLNARIASAITAVKLGKWPADQASTVLDSLRLAEKNIILLMFAIKQDQLNHRFFMTRRRAAKIVADYNARLNLAFASHFDPLFDELQKVIGEKNSSHAETVQNSKCVNLN